MPDICEGIRRNKLMLVLFVCVVWDLWDFGVFFQRSTLVNDVKAQTTSTGNWGWSRHCSFV